MTGGGLLLGGRGEFEIARAGEMRLECERSEQI